MALKHWKKISEETLHESPWIEYKHDRFDFGDGRQGNYYYLDSPGSSMIVPVTDDGKLLLVNQYRYLGNRESLEFPCGNVRHRHPDGRVTIDDPVVAARRELAEECGVTGELTHIGVYHPCNGFLNENAHVFLARRPTQESATPDPEEEFEIIALTPAALEEKIASGEIWDGMTIVAWTLAKPHLTDIL